MAITLGQKIRILRKGRKLTQQELADKLNINRSSISNYEIDRRVPSLKEIERMAEYFGVGLDYFGIVSKDEIFDLLSRAKEVFNNDKITKEKKDELYKELLKLYLSLDEK